MCKDSLTRAAAFDEPPGADETARWFHEQLLSALDGDTTSLPFFKTVHSPLVNSPSGQSALVAVASLTDLHAARAEIVSGRWKLQDVGQWTRLPALVRPETRDEYFDCIAQLLAPHVRPNFKIGLCLPFPLETVGSVSVVRPPAESAWHDSLDGADPARELLLALGRAGVNMPGTVRCVAVSVAVLLAGIVLPETNFRNTASLVLYGGGQAAYIEQSRPGQPIVAVTAALDVLTGLAPAAAAAGEATEDLASLGSVLRLHAREACSRGCFTPAAARHLRAMKRLSTRSVCAWLDERRPEPTMDEAAFFAMADQMFRRVSLRYAASAAGVLRRATRHNPQESSFLVIHGALFNVSRIFRDYLRSTFHSINPSCRVPSCHFAQVNNDVLIGTACAALQRTASDFSKKAEASAV